MIQGLKDYSKSVYRNRITGFGYVNVGIALLISIIEHETGAQIPIVNYACAITGAASIGLTSAGLGTWDSYRKTRSHIEEHGTIDPRFKDVLYDSYCLRTGLMMAAKEADLEHLL